MNVRYGQLMVFWVVFLTVFDLIEAYVQYVTMFENSIIVIGASFVSALFPLLILGSLVRYHPKLVNIRDKTVSGKILLISAVIAILLTDSVLRSF